MKEITLGFEVGEGKAVKFKPAHAIVTGVTQLSGKSTTLDAMAKRSGLRTIVFKTKVGEKEFSGGTLIPPYFKERSDWQFVESLCAAAMKEKMKFERSWIIRATKGTSTLYEVRAKIDEFLAKEKLRAMDRDIFTNLAAYLDIILPELRYANFSNTLTVNPGMNVIDLEKFRVEVQHLIISSVMEEVLNSHKGTIVVMPEAWKHLPQGRGTPCKLAAISFIRQGATNDNFLWIDSQDITGVDKETLKQVSTWILGLQMEKNEVKRTLDQMPVPKKLKPNTDDIMTLEKGQFFLCTPRMVKKVYVQPIWLDTKTAKRIALGKKSVDDVVKPEKLVPYEIKPREAGFKPRSALDVRMRSQHTKLQEDIAEIRNDFFNKITEIRDYVNKIGLEVMNLKKELPSEDMLVSLVLQKMPMQASPAGEALDEEALIRKVLARVPTVAGAVTYEVAPLEKIQKNFLEETKSELLQDISSLDDQQKKILKFVEAAGKGVNMTEITERGLFKKVGGGTMQKSRDLCKDMNAKNLIRYDTSHGRVFAKLKNRIKDRLQFHGATDGEVQQVYDHVIMEMLK